MNQDYYVVLGVSSDAEPEVIATAYKALAKKYHPDVSSSPDSERRLQQLNEAYATLRNPQLRAEYDQRMSRDVYGEADVDEGLVAIEPEMTVADVPELSPGKPAGIASLLSDALYLLIGVPIIWVIAVFLCDVLINAIIWTALEWLTSSEFGVSAAVSAVLEAAGMRYDAWTAEAEIREVSLLATAVTAGFMFICVKAATSAVVEHTREEKPHIPLWMAFASVLALFAFLAVRNIPDPTSMPQSLVIKEWVVLAAIFAAVLSSFREATGKR